MTGMSQELTVRDSLYGSSSVPRRRTVTAFR